jgi:hypothetical protein
MSLAKRRTQDRVEVVKATLLELAEKNNRRLSPAVVLEHARDPGSALHDEFEWDDTKAGEAFRLVQAGALIRSVRIKVVTESDNPKRVSISVQRAIVSVPSLRGSDEGSYVPITALADTTELVREIIEQLERLKKKHENLTQLAGVWKAIDEIQR